MNACSFGVRRHDAALVEVTCRLDQSADMSAHSKMFSLVGANYG